MATTLSTKLRFDKFKFSVFRQSYSTSVDNNFYLYYLSTNPTWANHGCKLIQNMFSCFDHWIKSILEVCVPELVLNETRQDKTGGQFLNWQDQNKTTFLLSRGSGKSRKNPGNIHRSPKKLNNITNCLEQLCSFPLKLGLIKLKQTDFHTRKIWTHIPNSTLRF